MGNGGLADQMAARMRRDGTTVGGDAINGTSIFDPVLAELLIRWFCPERGMILDPYAGGSVRGLVASRLGREYVGIDLRPEQCEANERQALVVVEDGGPEPAWICADSHTELRKEPHRFRCDMILTCPPYVDLEEYSDDPRDISNMEYKQFFSVFSETMELCARHLRDDRFAVIVVGDARGKDGAYYGFPAHCVAMMQGYGLKLWNEQIIVTPAGSLPSRARKGFVVNRKTGRSHQTAYVFLKGDPKRAVEACGVCQFGDNDPLEGLDGAFEGDPLDGLGIPL